MRLVVLPLTKRWILEDVVFASLLALLFSAAIYAALFLFSKREATYFLYVFGAVDAAFIYLLSLYYGDLKKCVAEILAGGLAGNATLYVQGFYKDFYGYHPYSGTEDLGANPAVEPGMYHVDAAGCIRVPVARVRKDGCPELLVAVLDPNKACSLEGGISARYGDNYATATFIPTAPGRVKIRMECTFNDNMVAELYLSCYKVMECKTSGVFEQELDLRGIDEPIVFIADSERQLKSIAKYMRTAIAGLCSGAAANLELQKVGGGASLPSTFIKPYAFSQKNPLPHCEIYTTVDVINKVVVYPYSCDELVGGFKETYYA